MMHIFMQIPGIKGSATEKNYQDWIRLTSFSLLSTCNVRTNVGQSNNRVVGAPKFSDLKLTKPADASTLALFSAACASKAHPKVTVEFCHADGNLQADMRYELEDVVISRFEQNYLPGCGLVESLDVNYTSIEQSLLSKALTPTPQRAGYSLERAELL